MVGIVGCGHVGKAMNQLFPNAVLFDKYLDIGSIDEINKCEVAFICVPTPMSNDGSCDTSCLDEVLSWIESRIIVIRSTVPIGYTKSKQNELGKRIVFQPEYYGETKNHPLANLKERDWIVLGGNNEDTTVVANIYKKEYTSEIRIIKVESDVAEMAKYMTNTYLATKVIFCNEMYDIAKAYGIDYDILREVWLMDPRINRSHTFVFEDDRGYGGSCFPKDMNALLFMSDKKNVKSKLVQAAIEKNEDYRD